ncbi:N-(5'-phosphoribosyl)anthranilate isomerase [Candidatus Poribacteria bacterium]|nr:N-(5'-phosphoribosyl)anthranilate isomerase [Candidatus Poribacteria bacterium]
MVTRVKICCIASVEEANLAINFGAWALGLVGHMPSGPGVISDLAIAKITSSVPSYIKTCLLTSETTADGIITHHRKTSTNMIQIVDSVDRKVYEVLRKELPKVSIVQVVHVTDRSVIDTALKITSYVDYLLLDSGNPNLAIRELGGTGRTHNWELSAEIVERSSIPVFLAGGLGGDNVKSAIEKVNPFGIDLCSKIRTKNRLDQKKLQILMERVTENS